MLSSDEAEKVFDAIDVNELSESEAEALVAAVQDAPESVRTAFEKEVNIFGGAVDSYVPIGSTIPVSERRTLIAVVAVSFAAPIVARRKW